MNGALNILRLDLLAYGPFTGKSLDFSACSKGLHIVYGPNEAGKSTALKALRALLFGIEQKTDADFLHPYSDLRIGAELELADGKSIYVIRRKGNANTLRAADDSTPIDPQLIDSLLGHVHEQAFKTRFGICHDDLVEGGKKAVKFDEKNKSNNDDDIGQLLFAASAGIAHLRDILAEFRQQAEKLFKQRGQIPEINAALDKYKKAAKNHRALQLSEEDWIRQESELAYAKAELERIEHESAALESQRQRLGRYAAALSVASRRAAVLAELKPLGDVPPLSDDFCQRRRDTAEQLRLTTHARERTERELVRIDARLADLGLPPAILEHAKAVDATCAELSVHVKAARDRVDRVTEVKQFGEQIERHIDRIGGESDHDEMRIVVRTAERARIEELGRQFHELSERCKNAERRRAQDERRMAELSAQLAAYPTLADGDVIKRLLARLQRLVAEEAQHAADANRLAAEGEQFAIGVARLARWDRDLDVLERLAVPAEETVERFDAELTSAHASVDKAAQRRGEAAAEKSRIEASLSVIQSGDAIPSDADLANARQQRDAAWQALRDAIASEEFDTYASHAAAFEPLVSQADALADRLRRDAKAVAERASLENELCRKSEVLERAENQLRLATDERDAVHQRWAGLWRACGIDPGTPREMLAWLAERRRLCEHAAALRTRRAEQQTVAKRLDDARQDAIVVIGDAGGSIAPPITLTLAVDTLDATYERIDNERKRRQQLDVAHAQAARDLSETKNELAETEASLAGWRAAWAVAVAPLGHEDALTPAQAQALLGELAEVQNLLDKRQACASRVADIDRDVREFAKQLADVAGQACGDLDLRQVSDDNMRGVEAAVDELARRLAAAREAAMERKKLVVDRQRQSAELANVREDAGVANATMGDLCREARAASAEELPGIEERWRRHGELRRQIADFDERLHEHAAGAPLVEFLEELAAVDADTLPAEQSRLASRLAELGGQSEPLGKRIWSLEHNIKTDGGRDVAAVAYADMQGLRAQLEDDVCRYARLRLASAVLRRAIERYREKNQDPLLRRARDIFSRLTCGAFTDLKTDYDDQRPVLVAVRAETSKAVGVAGMSDGTCDQLYLALRLASVEQYIDAHPAIPFIVDDVLQRFDDGRAAAALAALAELGRRTQVIFFTHHQHVLDLAARNLGEADYFVHCLGEDAPAVGRGRRKTATAAEVTDSTPALF
ncbi:MAG: AAA family ATPase [Pirellulales bacterium]